MPPPVQARQEPPSPDLVAGDAGSHSEGFAVSPVAHWHQVSSSEWPRKPRAAGLYQRQCVQHDQGSDYPPVLEVFSNLNTSMILWNNF